MLVIKKVATFLKERELVLAKKKVLKIFMDHAQRYSVMADFFNRYIPDGKVVEDMKTKHFEKTFPASFEHLQSRFDLGYFTADTKHWDDNREMFRAIFQTLMHNGIEGVDESLSLSFIYNQGEQGILSVFSYRFIERLMLNEVTHPRAKACQDSLMCNMAGLGYDFERKEQEPEVDRHFHFMFNQMKIDMRCYVDVFESVYGHRNIVEQC